MGNSDFFLSPDSVIIMDKTLGFTLWSKSKGVDRSGIAGSGAGLFLGHCEAASWSHLCFLLWKKKKQEIITMFTLYVAMC